MGGFRNFIDGKGHDYKGIDIVKLIDDERIQITDGQTIPYSNKFDIIYSVNVFQHLTDYQRTSYYHQIYNSLEFGGIFICSMFVLTPENSDTKWSLKDENGNGYVFTLNSLTRAPKLIELEEELKSIGFKWDTAEIKWQNNDINENMMSLVIQK